LEWNYMQTRFQKLFYRRVFLLAKTIISPGIGRQDQALPLDNSNPGR
jgi:hypothetical protein